MNTLFKNNRGQSFIEFVFLMITMMGMSLVLLNGVNGGLAERWKNFVAVITDTDVTTIKYTTE